MVNFLRIVTDLLITAVIWNLVYFIRFHTGLFSHSGIPPFSKHVLFTIPIVLIFYASKSIVGIYKSIRIQSTLQQLRLQVTSIFLGFTLSILFFYYAENVPYTRVLLLLFLFGLMAGTLLSHYTLLSVLRYLRSKGYNLRYFAIIGAGRKALKLLQDIQNHPYLGLSCSFLIDDKPRLDGRFLHGVRVYGHIDRLREVLQEHPVDEIYLANHSNQVQSLYPILRELQDEGTNIRILPDWGKLTAMSRISTVVIGSSILFTTDDPPLSGMNLILKDLFDRACALFLLLIFSLPMLAIACAIRLTSGGPVFYRQKRIGMDRKIFEIIKFRTMKTSDPDDPGWTIPDDPRRTRIGKFLRSTSLDELPQLFNVLKGDMSLVGPRPEQVHFVEKFSEEYRHYMFRHKVKSGMTGWAQVHGYRGNTPLRKRIQYDLNYIQNWSVWLDLLILIRTPFRMFREPNAY